MTTTTPGTAAAAGPTAIGQASGRAGSQPTTHHAAGTARDLLLSVLAPASWGTTYVVTSELLPDHRPMLAATMRALEALSG